MVVTCCSWLRGISIRRESKWIVRRRPVGKLLFRETMVVMVVARRSSQHQRGRQNRGSCYSLMRVGVMVVMVSCWSRMRRLRSLAVPLTGSGSVPALDTVAVFSAVFSQSASILSAVDIFGSVRVPGWAQAGRGCKAGCGSITTNAAAETRKHATKLTFNARLCTRTYMPWLRPLDCLGQWR